MAAVGILGGTFNPPHIGHLVCAQEARFQLGLDRVVLMPVHRPPHKDGSDDAGPQERVAMCRLAAAASAVAAGGAPWLEVSTLEVDRGGASYTVDTLRALTAQAPQDDLTFIVGGDMADSFASWREPRAVLDLATFAVAEREGAGHRDLAARLEGLAGADGKPHERPRVRVFAMPRLDVSSTDIRVRVAAGAPIRHLVPDAVADHIADRGLYGAGAPGEDRR